MEFLIDIAYGDRIDYANIGLYKVAKSESMGMIMMYLRGIQTRRLHIVVFVGSI